MKNCGSSGPRRFLCPLKPWHKGNTSPFENGHQLTQWRGATSQNIGAIFPNYTADKISKNTRPSPPPPIWSCLVRLSACNKALAVCIGITVYEIFYPVTKKNGLEIPLTDSDWFQEWKSYYSMFFLTTSDRVTFILLTWRIWWAPNNASKWQMGFNSAFKGLTNERRN